MATVTETEATGRALRVLRSIDAAGNSSWYKLSLWSRASDVAFADNKTAQTKLGAINGITSDVNATAADIAASIGVVHNVNAIASAANTRSTNNAAYLGNCRFFYEGGKYYIQAGADAGTKKPLGSGLEGLKKIIYESFYGGANNSPRVRKTIEKGGNYIVFRENLDYRSQNDQSIGLLDDMCEDVGMWYGHAYLQADGSLPNTYPYDPYHEYVANNVHQQHSFYNAIFDIKRHFPNDYRDWTAENFYFVPKIVYSSCDHDQDNNIGHPPKFGILKKYDAITGKLTIGPIKASWTESWGSDSDPKHTRNGRHIMSFSAWELLIIS